MNQRRRGQRAEKAASKTQCHTDEYYVTSHDEESDTSDCAMPTGSSAASDMSEEEASQSGPPPTGSSPRNQPAFYIGNLQILHVGTVSNLSNVATVNQGQTPPHEANTTKASSAAKEPPGSMASGGARPKARSSSAKSETAARVNTIPEQSSGAGRAPEDHTQQQSCGLGQPLHVHPPAPVSQSKSLAGSGALSPSLLCSPHLQTPISEKPPSPREVVIVGMPTLEQISQTLDRVTLERKIGQLERDLNRERSMGRKKDDKLREKEGEVANLMQQLEKLDNEVNEYKDILGEGRETKRKKTVREGEEDVEVLFKIKDSREVEIHQELSSRQTNPAARYRGDAFASELEPIDLVAKEACKRQCKTATELLDLIAFKPGVSDTVQKVRAIFTWLCHSDLAQAQMTLSFPEEAGNGSYKYSHMLCHLCREVHIECEVIRGHLSICSSGHQAAEDTGTGVDNSHWWNAVNLGSCGWHLLDAYCAATVLRELKAVDQYDYYQEAVEQFFLPEPQDFITTHFPKHSQWQLLAQPWTLAQFQSQIPVKAIFKHGLRIVTHGQKVKCASNGTVSILVECSAGKADSIEFDFSLTYLDGRTHFKGWHLNMFGRHHMENNMAVFTIRPPEKATYRLKLASCDRKTSVGVSHQPGVICEYEIRCEASPQSPMPWPYRDLRTKTWGSNRQAAEFDLTPEQAGVAFISDGSPLELSFRMGRPLRFLPILCEAGSNKTCKDFVLSRVINHSVCIFRIIAPAAGEYGLTIFATDPTADDDNYYLVYQYLITCTQQVEHPDRFPVLPVDYLGPQPAASKCQLSAISHTDPYIDLHGCDLQLSFKAPLQLNLTTKLIACHQTQGASTLQGRTLSQIRSNSLSFSLRFPKPGLYKFEGYALPADEPSDKLPNVFNYVIHCHDSGSDHKFPVQLPNKGRHPYYLHEPLNGVLKSCTEPVTGSRYKQYKQRFKIEVPRVHEVCVVWQGDWTQLDELNPGLWEGEVAMKKYPGCQGKVVVCTRKDSNSKGEPLLQYVIED